MGQSIQSVRVKSEQELGVDVDVASSCELFVVYNVILKYRYKESSSSRLISRLSRLVHRCLLDFNDNELL